MKIKKVAVVGQGQFGAFMGEHLAKYVTVVPVLRSSDPKIVSECEVIIFAVPYSGLEDAIKMVKKYVPPQALIADVSSVKQKPIALMQKHFKSNQIIGTHPVFGPQSGKNGIEGLPVVLCNVSCTQTTYKNVALFLKNKLKLQVIEETPQQHDHEMANVQALTHFIGRALLNLEIKSYVTNTQSYAQLLEVASLLKDDSWELFKTIQNTNPEAKKVRKKLLTELLLLEKKLIEN